VCTRDYSLPEGPSSEEAQQAKSGLHYVKIVRTRANREKVQR
jgi:hypothetical protein